MKIGVISTSNGGVDYHRLLRPFALLQDDYEVERWTNVSPEMYDANIDVLVFSRFLPVREQNEFLNEMRKRGTYIICDVDDYWVLPSNHVAAKVNKQARPLMIDAMSMADEVWTTHELLAGYIERLNRNVYVIPNALDPNEEQWKPKEDYGTRIGWAGGVTHFDDLMKTKDAWNGIHPVICGYKKEPAWKRLADNFEADYVEGLDVENYGLLYEKFDIAIAPLERSLFTSCKSNLKILESGLKGLPIFVENQHPYTDDATGIYRVDNWATALQEAQTMEAETVKAMGQELRSYVLDNYDLNQVNELRRNRLK